MAVEVAHGDVLGTVAGQMELHDTCVGYAHSPIQESG
ncbi:Uncharacterised protein [Brucella intermedia]|nr:Uncharacterised protein [Brucella intermedia]